MSQDDTVYHHEDVENPPTHSAHDDSVLTEENLQSYWRANRRVVTTLLSIWAIITFGFCIIMGGWLDQFTVGGFPLGFWFSQQGGMLVYIALIFIYHIWMLKIEREHGVDDDSEAKALKRAHKKEAK